MSRAEALAWLQKFDAELQPCEHCGRVMLVGRCCDKA
jgi:hypothetical protein